MIRAAHHYHKAGDHEYSAKLLTSNISTVISRGQAQVARELLDKLPFESFPLALQGDMEEAKGEIYIFKGDYDAAISSYKMAMLLASQAPVVDPELIARFHRKTGKCHEKKGNWDDSLQWYERGIAKLPENSVSVEVVRLQRDIATVYYHTKRYLEAIQECDAGLRRAEGHEWTEERAGIYNIQGLVFRRLKDYLKAIDAFTQSHVLFRSVGDKWSQAKAGSNRGIAYLESGDHDSALQDIQASLSLFQMIGALNDEAGAHNNLGMIYFDQKKYLDARLEYEQASLLLQTMGAKPALADCFYNRGEVCLILGKQLIAAAQPGEARSYLREAVEHLSKSSQISQELKNKALEVESDGLCTEAITLYKQVSDTV